MSSHSENARTTIEYRGSRIECSDAVSAKCLKAIELADKEEVADLLTAKGANLNEICVCWATCHDDSRPERYTATPLTLAAKFASCDFILWMLKHGADPNVKCDLTPLGVAVSMNNKRLVALVVDSGADVDLKSRNPEDESRGLMQTPLRIACSKGYFTIATYLLLQGAFCIGGDITENSFANDAEKYREWKREEMFPISFPGTVYPNARNYRRWTGPNSFPDTVHLNFRPYRVEKKKMFSDQFSACFLQHRQKNKKEFPVFSCPFLDRQVFSCSFLDSAKNTPLHYACADGDKELIKRILKKCEQIDARNIENQSPAEVAFDFGRLEIVFMLIQYGCTVSHRMLSDTYSCGNTLLHIACQQGRESVAQKLIEAGSSLNVTNSEGKSPAEVAFDFGRLEIVLMLIEHGCTVSHRMLSDTYSCGNTLLHIACQQGKNSVAKKLIEAGSSLSVTNSEGKSPMHYAWLNRQLRETVLDVVFDRISSFYEMYLQSLNFTEVKSLQLESPHVRCFRNGYDGFDIENNYDDLRVYELALYKTLCTVVSEVPLGSFAVRRKVTPKYSRQGRLPWYRPSGGVNLTREYLCSFCGKLTPEACYFLQERGMFDDVLLFSGCCGTSYANKQLALQLHTCRVDIGLTKSSESDLKLCIEELIQKGANVNAADCRGNTPLHIACRDGASEDIINMLLDCGANLHVVNNIGRTPLDYAADTQNGQLLLSTIDRVDDDILSTVSSKREASTKLLMLARADVGLLSQQLAYRLAYDGARINLPATPSCGSTARRSCLLDILACDGEWGAVCELVRMGCCDYTDAMFKSMFQILSFRDQISFYNKVQVWKWFSLAGFWQNNDFTAQFESFLEVEFHHWQPERDTHTDASAATATSELEWLKNDVRNPSSLLRQCVYTIRRQLILADTTGRTIFPSIEKLPLPTRLKDSLKLEALEASAERFVEPY